MLVWKTGEKLCKATGTDTFLLAEEQNNLILLTDENTVWDICCSATHTVYRGTCIIPALVPFLLPYTEAERKLILPAPVCAVLEIITQDWLHGFRVTDIAVKYLETSAWRFLEPPLMLCA